MNAVSTILGRAADEMSKRGKARQNYINSRGNVCAIGAIRIACGSVVVDEVVSRPDQKMSHRHTNWDLVSSATNALDMYLEEHGYYPTKTLDGHNIPDWNDRNNKETVVKAMREASKYYKAA